jgi:hypothetical protein
VCGVKQGKNMDTETLALAIKIASVLQSQPAATTQHAGAHVLIRTYSAGVHFGTMQSRNGREVTLTNARRIWSWTGANTLSEIALRGVGSGSKVSDAVPSITLTEAIEIVPLSPDAIANLGGAKWIK